VKWWNALWRRNQSCWPKLWQLLSDHAVVRIFWSKGLSNIKSHLSSVATLPCENTFLTQIRLCWPLCAFINYINYIIIYYIWLMTISATSCVGQRKIFKSHSQGLRDKRLLMYACKCLVVSSLSGQLRYANASFWTNLVLYITHCVGYSLPLLRQNLNHVARTFN